MSENNIDLKQEIKNLRLVVEKSVETLRKLESTGTGEDANRALWAVSAIWNGKEYSDIETALRAKGHKSAIDMINRK